MSKEVKTTKITATETEEKARKRSFFESIAFTLIGWAVVFATETLLRGKASDLVCSILNISGATLSTLGPGVKLVVRFFGRKLEVEKTETTTKEGDT